MKRVLQFLIIVIALSNLATYTPSRDWRIRDVASDGWDIKKFKTKCLNGNLYYVYGDSMRCIPVLDKNEKMVKCVTK